MLFKLVTAGSEYKYVQTRRKLEELGFSFDGNKIIKTDSVKINIDTLDDLMEFMREFGPVIMSEEQIVIYDDEWES